MLWAAFVVALALHAAMLIGLRGWLQPPSLIDSLPPPFYTRMLYPQARSAPVPAHAHAHRPVATHPRRRVVASIRSIPLASRSVAAVSVMEKAASAPEPEASLAQAAAETASEAASATASETTPETASQPVTEPASADVAASVPASAPPAAVSSSAESAPAPILSATASAAAPVSATAASASASAAEPPAYLSAWPSNTRLSYALTGNYRGALHGSARVLWQRLFTDGQARYQTSVQLDVGLLLSMRFTSQGRIDEDSLAPQAYEQQLSQNRRSLRIGEDIVLNSGKHVPRPDNVQDTASQFIELAHRFASGQARFAPGGSVPLWLARPTGVDEWVYDMLGEETLYLPRLGAVRAIHLKPRRLNKPDNPISAEVWLAPSLQYLPVRILLTQGADKSVDLMVDTIEQQ